MDYEKAYKEALERAKAGKPLDEVFPELNESDDERIRKSLVEYFRKFTPENMWDEMFSFGDVVSYLERQKEQKPAEWSEEDEDTLGDAITAVDLMLTDDYEESHPILFKAFLAAKSWLKSLPERFNLQPHWKPSEEQMKALNEVANNGVLLDLFNDLLKLL